MTAEPSDTLMRDAPEDDDAPTTLELSEDEKRVLALYDQLRSIRLEIALLRAREAFTGEQTPSSQEDIEALQNQLLEARAAYVLRNEVVDSVLTVNPVLKAVHGATQASPIERDLLPAVQRRDAVSKDVAREASARRDVRDESVAAAVECRQLEQKNVQLAGQVRELAAAVAATNQTTDPEGDDDDAAVQEKKQLEADVKTSRQRWKLIKGTASAIVVGSGVDWSREAALCEIVLDPE
ncbi:hypothetical protein SEUCBS139899_001043 [Sporothrix eucalyptigena]|uniref:Centromere protein H C-terminal domain-containing protein n=1 Tax=Sporothrix eucalyptigena TaxID=1812306 RepID=A0ABP0D239_9PEZI